MAMFKAAKNVVAPWRTWPWVTPSTWPSPKTGHAHYHVSYLWDVTLDDGYRIAITLEMDSAAMAAAGRDCRRGRRGARLARRIVQGVDVSHTLSRRKRRDASLAGREDRVYRAYSRNKNAATRGASALGARQLVEIRRREMNLSRTSRHSNADGPSLRAAKLRTWAMG